MTKNRWKNPTVLPPAAALQFLAARITEALLTPGTSAAPEAAECGPARFLRIETAIDTIAPLDWLCAQGGGTQYYWASRNGAFVMAGMGEADVVTPSDDAPLAALFARLRTYLNEHTPSLRYYGGFRFHKGPVKGERWRAFKEYRFVVPRFELIRRDGGLFLACNLRVTHPRTNAMLHESLMGDLGALRFPEAPPDLALPPMGRRSDLPDRAGWHAMVDRALTDIEAGGLEKVVVARESLFQAADSIAPVALLRRLADQAPSCYHFCFHPAPGRAFIGASPERLFKRANAYLRTEALAGTRPRGRTDAADHMMGETLLHSDKERREHQIVVRAIETLLRPKCRHIEIENAPSLMRLRHCQHLHTRIEAILDDPDADASLIECLHPTPAVGGLPRSRALQWIAAQEPFDRGIYAAPAGWVGYDAAEFCVAIRSGLVQENTLAVYTGAGIVAGADPEEEWEEINSKLAAFLAAIQAD